jgi:hypothetical protein
MGHLPGLGKRFRESHLGNRLTRTQPHHLAAPRNRPHRRRTQRPRRRKSTIFPFDISAFEFQNTIRLRFPGAIKAQWEKFVPQFLLRAVKVLPHSPSMAKYRYRSI